MSTTRQKHQLAIAAWLIGLPRAHYDYHACLAHPSSSLSVDPSLLAPEVRVREPWPASELEARPGRPPLYRKTDGTAFLLIATTR